MGNVMMEASQINYRGGVTKMSVEQALKETSGEAAAIAALQAAVGNLQTGKADLPVIAPEFDAETGVYAVGDLVMYQGKLYEFTTAHETAGDWNSTEVTEKTVSDEIDSLKSGLTNVQHSFTKRIFVLSAQYAEPYYLFEWNIALDGWYPLAVAGFRGSHVNVNISNITVSGSENKLYCDVYNIAGNNIPSDYKVTVDVLYTKSIMI